MPGETAAPPGHAASIIIPTLASRPELMRAIESVLRQDTPSLPIVVVNGDRADPAILARLRERADIRLIIRPEPGSPGARLAGREAVETPLFGFLDDDDELLADAVSVMQAALSPAHDAVVCNALLDEGGARRIMYLALPSDGDDSEMAIVRGMWLHLGAVLYRTDAAPPRHFADLPFHCHVTLMALRAARDLRLHFLNRPVVIRYMGADAQASLSERYLRIVPLAMRQAAAEARRPDVRRGLRRKEAAAYHQLSEYYRSRGQAGAAWRAHFRTLRSGGLRYLPVSRHLLAASLGMRSSAKVS